MKDLRNKPKRVPSRESIESMGQRAECLLLTHLTKCLDHQQLKVQSVQTKADSVRGRLLKKVPKADSESLGQKPTRLRSRI